MKNNWTKRATAAAMAALMISTLTYCGASGTGSAAGTADTTAAAQGETQTDAQVEAQTTEVSSSKTLLDPANPVTINIWNYYNGQQLEAFEKLTDEFNSTVGVDKGIVVNFKSQGDINTLADELLDAVAGKAGAEDVPTLAAVYSETAYILFNDDKLRTYDEYFTQDELDKYVPGFIDEGRFAPDGKLRLFPIFKSTELFSLNTTDFEPFAEATGWTEDKIDSKEALAKAAEEYYNWTDEQTPDVPEDGKAFYGRDSVANYMFAGAYQLGHDIVPMVDGNVVPDIDHDTFRTLWDNYYIPYINGYFGAFGKYRSDDEKTGMIIALTSSSSSVNYLPTKVTLADDTTHDIVNLVTSELDFQNSIKDITLQQGASYCMMSEATDAQAEASAEFMKWCTDPAQNMSFSLDSGYSPVTVEANNADAIKAAFSEGGNAIVLDSLMTSAENFSTKEAYTPRAYQGSKAIRAIVESAMNDVCKADREAVLQAIAAGKTREEAVAQYTTDEYFETWYAKLKSDVEAIA